MTFLPGKCAGDTSWLDSVFAALALGGNSANRGATEHGGTTGKEKAQVECVELQPRAYQALTRGSSRTASCTRLSLG
jgi:hypothetical protein